MHVIVAIGELSAGQAQPGPDADTKVVPAGTGSVTVMSLRDVEGPRFDTFSVYVTF